MNQESITPEDDILDQRWTLRYIVLTALLAAPLLWAFLTINNFYPVPVWSLFSDAVSLNAPTDYYVLKGEFADGMVRPISAIDLSGALTGRIHLMVDYVMSNSSLDLPSPHPRNVALIDSAGGPTSLAPGTRLPDLLRAWGAIYNRHHPGHPVRAVVLEQLRWRGVTYSDFAMPVRTWRTAINQ